LEHATVAATTATTMTGKAVTVAATAAPSLQSMVARFQERASQLTREQSLLDYEQQALQELEKTEQEQKNLLDKDRREFLHVRLDRDTAEEMVLSCREKTTKLRKEIERLQQEMTEYQTSKDNNDSEVQVDLFGKKEFSIPSHRRRRILYKDYLKGCIDQVVQAEQVQQNKRKAIQMAIQKLQDKRQAVDVQTGHVQTQTTEKQQEIVHLTSRSHVLADKVRTAVATRTQLREDIRQSRG
jgi:uncharacterized protein (UPF0147 family)